MPYDDGSDDDSSSLPQSCDVPGAGLSVSLRVLTTPEGDAASMPILRESQALGLLCDLLQGHSAGRSMT